MHIKNSARCAHINSTLWTDIPLPPQLKIQQLPPVQKSMNAQGEKQEGGGLLKDQAYVIDMKSVFI